MKVDRSNAEKLCLIHWMLKRFAAGDHGCLTGDCPHDMQDECVEALYADFLRRKIYAETGKDRKAALKLVGESLRKGAEA